MARIRTIKPEFFRHELLQELEEQHPQNHPMLVFAGLFGHCDKEGHFPWRPKHLKLDILPFLQFDMVETLSILEKAELVVQYNIPHGDLFGWIPTFTDHQAISGKESQAPAKYPEPSDEVIEKHTRIKREVSETAGREGKGRELGREPLGSASPVDKSKANGNGAWWKTHAGIDEMGKKLGLLPNRGEQYPEYKARLFDHLNAQGSAA